MRASECAKLDRSFVFWQLPRLTQVVRAWADQAEGGNLGPASGNESYKKLGDAKCQAGVQRADASFISSRVINLS